MRPRFLTAALLAGLLATVTVSTQAPGPRQLEVSFDQEGHVTLIANNVTLREILAEWARQGGTRIVNLEKLAGGPIEYPIRFEKAAEMEVMQALLRGVAGKAYVPRMLGTPGASRLEIVHLTPTSNASGALVAAPVVSPNPNVPTRGAPEDEIPPVNRPQPGQAAPPPGQAQGNQPQQWQQQQQPALPQGYQQQSPMPGMPGSALPGSGLPGGSALPQIVPITPINSNQPATSTQPPATNRGAPPPPPTPVGGGS